MRPRWRWIATGAVATLVLGLVVIGAGAVIAPSVARAAAPLPCPANTIYVINDNVLMSVNTSTLTSASVIALPGVNDNALGMDANGDFVYFLDRNGTTQQVDTYNVVAGTFATGPSVAEDNNNTGVSGAVDPVNGDYYFSGGDVGTLEMYDPTTAAITAVGAYSGAVAGAALANGDLVFDSVGNGYLISEGNLYRFLPHANGAGQVALTVITTGLPDDPDGVAFGSDGYLYMTTATAAEIEKVDPIDGSVQADASDTGPDATGTNTDAASCNFPGVLTLQKDLPSGRKQPTDQFHLAITGGGTQPGPGTEATTTGTASAVQSQKAGPVISLTGEQYTITETATSGALADYDQAWSCVDTLNGNAVVGSGTGSSGTFTYPVLGPTGSNVVCTFTNTVIPPPQPVTTKTLLSVNGVAATANQAVQAGDVLRYELTVSEAGSVPGSTTLLETVPANTEYTGTGEGWTVAGASYSQAVGPVAAGQSVHVLFTVTVDNPLPAGAATITNTVRTTVGTCTGCTVSNPIPPVLAQTGSDSGASLILAGSLLVAGMGFLLAAGGYRNRWWRA